MVERFSIMASGSWSEVELEGHLVDLFEPATPNEFGYVVIYLHGVHLTRLNENEIYTRQFDERGLRVVAPMTQRSWWTDRICEEFDPQISAQRHLLQRVMPFIEERYGAKPPKIGLLGTSMGGQGALRLAFQRPHMFPVTAAISPAIDFHFRFRQGDETLTKMYRDEEQARQDTATLHVHPLNWPRHVWFCCDPADFDWQESADRLQMKLASMGIPHVCDLESSAGGHGWDYYNHMAGKAVEFIIENLDRERLRIV